MIKYSLVCEKEHDFDGWFASSSDYDKQRKRGFVECPMCGSKKISKALMRPSISGTKQSNSGSQEVQNIASNMPQEVVEKIREIKKSIEQNSENVGEKFPEEARKIHYGETDKRAIYGKASVEEAIGLAEEGVSIVPIPDLPEEKN